MVEKKALSSGRDKTLGALETSVPAGSTGGYSGLVL
jgi:hypothetical protein